MSIGTNITLLEALDTETVRRLSDYNKISGWLWIVFGGVQIILILPAIAGVWNVVAGASRLKMSKNILLRDSRIPSQYESIAQLIVIGVINLLLGAIIGVVFVAFDFYIRDKILSNRRLFDGGVVRSTSVASVKDTGIDYDELEQYFSLKERGIITEVEFVNKKNEILGL